MAVRQRFDYSHISGGGGGGFRAGFVPAEEQDIQTNRGAVPYPVASPDLQDASRLSNGPLDANLFGAARKPAGPLQIDDDYIKKVLGDQQQPGGFSLGDTQQFAFDPVALSAAAIQGGAGFDANAGLDISSPEYEAQRRRGHRLNSLLNSPGRPGRIPVGVQLRIEQQELERQQFGLEAAKFNAERAQALSKLGLDKANALASLGLDAAKFGASLEEGQRNRALDRYKVDTTTDLYKQGLKGSSSKGFGSFTRRNIDPNNPLNYTEDVFTINKDTGEIQPYGGKGGQPTLGAAVPNGGFTPEQVQALQGAGITDEDLLESAQGYYGL